MNKSFQVNSASITDRGLSQKRPQNEDSYLEIPGKGIFAVADGVGGAQSGEVASQMAVEVLQQAFSQWTESIDAEDLMKRALEHANASIYQMSRDLPQLSTMATTVVALHIDGNIATIGHVGDSRLYRMDARGNLFRETQDHSVVEEEVRAGRMTASQAETHPSRNVISRALGAQEEVEVDMKTIMFEPESTFLLCSDGITRHISDVEIRELLNSCQTPLDVCREMKSLCFARGAEDNLTAVVIRVVGDTDFEEATIATARQNGNGNESQSKRIENFTSHNFESSNLAVAAADPQDTAIFRMEGGTGTDFNDENKAYERMKAERSQIIESSRGGLIGRLLGWIALIGLGIIIGAAGFFGLSRILPPFTPEPKPAETPNVKPPVDLAVSSFETNRRNVDREPRAYITANGAAAEDAEDFYLLGRANFLLADYSKAKSNLQKAKELIPQASEENRKTLDREIAMMNAIMADQDATKSFEREKMASINASAGNTNSAQ